MRTTLAIAALAGALAGCGFRAEKLFASYAPIEVREVGRSLYCGSGSDAASVVLLPGLQAVIDWQVARGVTLGSVESLAQAAYAIVEMGVRPTGGYGIAVARSAVLRGELVILQATFVSPAAGSLRTQAMSSPCVLVQLPPGRYASVEVQDPSGAVRAKGGAASAASVAPRAAGPAQ